jgi:raffinose/stachyose/melibiose transport system permease protein
MKLKRLIFRILQYVVLVAGLISIAIPLYVTVITALKTQAESTANFFALPKSLYLDNFKQILSNSGFFTYVMNSVVITVVAVVGISILLPMVSFAISRNMHKKYYRFLFFYFTIGIFIPFQVIMIPVSKLMTQLNLLNQSGLILLYITFSAIQGVFLYVGYMKTIPYELEEAAYIDGCTVVQSYIKIFLPMLKPMTATVLITNSLWIWNDFLLPLLILNRSDKYWTLQLFQYNFKSQYAFDYNLAFASFTLSMIPIVIVYFFSQKSMIAGLTSGAVKG